MASVALLVAAPAAASCGGVLPSSLASKTVRRAIVAADLLGLRDIGFPNAAVADGPSPLGLSADGRRVAFVVSQADVASNSYCRTLVVASTTVPGQVRVLDQAGEYRQHRGAVRGLFAEYGTPEITTPRWSSDGRTIAYLKRTGGRTQAWLVDAATGAAHALTDFPVDLETIAWSIDSRALTFSARPRQAAVDATVDAEGRSGWRYDDRMTPNAGPRPRLRVDDVPLEMFSVDIVTRKVRPATPDEQVRLADDAATLSATHAEFGDGMRVMIQPATTFIGAAQLAVQRGGQTLPCADPACRGSVVGVWWERGRQSAIFLRREGWRSEVSVLYRWRLGGGAPHRILATTDVLTGCVMAADALVCGRENSTTPRRVVRIDRDGRAATLFDPNPEFAAIALGDVRRLKWRNDRGFEAWGDLVLPPIVRPGSKLPLVIVQYHSRGFLRGGTNDEYPIFLLAARGFAVLSIERPPFVASLATGVMTAFEANASNFKDWADRRSVQSSIERGVGAALATGVIDSRRIGITGLSDGATSVRFALINAKLFAAAAISTCCVEPTTAMTLNGPRFADDNRKMGFPAAGDRDDQFWRPMSIAMNAGRISTPLLMQVADDEFLVALEAYEALRQHDRPVDMYVFPDEHHGKWQPAHRAAVYERNLDWFDFWLQRREDPAPAKRVQYARWRLLRAATQQ